LPSLTSRLLPGVLRAARANTIFVNPARAEEHLIRRSIRPCPFGPPPWLRRDVAVSVDHTAGWPVYTLTPKSAGTRGAVVYVHGGGWVNQIVPQHWQLAAQIAAAARLAVMVPIYPLAPLGTAGPVVAAVAELVRAGTARHGRVSLAGDSAGGQIALSAAIMLRDGPGIIVPDTVLISPALDLSLSNPQIDLVQPTDPWLGRGGMLVFIEHWRGNLPVDDPRVSPLAANLQGLGPLTVFSGTRDILNPDARLLLEKATAAGVGVDFHEAPGLVHVYPLTPTAEGRAARRLIVKRLASTVLP